MEPAFIFTQRWVNEFSNVLFMYIRGFKVRASLDPLLVFSEACLINFSFYTNYSSIFRVTSQVSLNRTKVCYHMLLHYVPDPNYSYVGSQMLWIVLSTGEENAVGCNA